MRHSTPMIHSSMVRFTPVVALALLLSTAHPADAGGTPDPGSSPLTVDSGDADTQPDNENQLLVQLGPDRGFFTGDYVTDALSGLQRAPAEADRDGFYRFGVEVPPGQGTLVVEIYDADVGASSPDATGIDSHDQNDEGAWETLVVYELLDPDGVSVASITLPPRDCDPATAGLQSGCDSAWSDLGLFTVSSPDPGHWTFRTRLTNPPGTQDDNNSFGLRAHDGDATAGGTEYNVYAQSYVGLGHVYGSSGSPANLSRTHDLFPYVSRDCSCDLNDFDLDDSGDESALLTPPRSPSTPFSFDFFSTFTNWNQNVASGFTSGADATNYGLWHLRWVVGRFNVFTFWMGTEAAPDPVNPAGGGSAPDTNPLADAIRLYLPADGSRFFGERGGADDAVLAPRKPWVGQSFAVISGADPFVGGVTSRVRVTITVDNPSAQPIQFDTATAGSNVITAQVPTNGGQTAYVPGSAAITNAGSAAGSATAVSGTGPWDLTFAPGVVDAGSTATLTYEIDVVPAAPGILDLTGDGATGTAATFLDETCADAAGGASACSATARSEATRRFGPLCPLQGISSGQAVLGAAKRVTSGPTSNGDGTFTVGFELGVENLGTEALAQVQLTDDLTATFPAPATVTAVGPPSATGTLAANPAFDGGGDPELLVAGSSTLAAGATATVQFEVTFDPNGLPGPFFNQAVAAGSLAAGGTVGDLSDDGIDPDGDGDGTADEAGENDPTPLVVVESPGLVVTKTAAPPVEAAGGLWEVAFTVTVENTGDVELTPSSLTDDLLAAFPAPASLVALVAGPTVTPSGGATLTANGGFDGAGDPELLAGGSLPVGSSAAFDFTVRFDAGGSTGPFVNVAAVAADTPQGGATSNQDAVEITVPAVPRLEEIPTLSEWTAALFAVLLLLAGLAVRRS